MKLTIKELKTYIKEPRPMMFKSGSSVHIKILDDEEYDRIIKILERYGLTMYRENPRYLPTTYTVERKRIWKNI